jgi:inosine/xanthosine triphosphatase
MKKVIIASKNPVKIHATEAGFRRMFPDENFTFEAVSAASGVSDQPMDDGETYCGAKNRADNALAGRETADYYVGIEGGIESFENDMQAFAWVVVKSDSKCGKARTASFFLPAAVVNLIKAGHELGAADDIIFKRRNSKQENGAVGILTENVINRTNYYTEAVILALIPFKNHELY